MIKICWDSLIMILNSTKPSTGNKDSIGMPTLHIGPRDLEEYAYKGGGALAQFHYRFHERSRRSWSPQTAIFRNINNACCNFFVVFYSKRQHT